MSRHSGKPLTEIEHLRQSVVDILTTPIGSRVMRRDYGSRLFDLIDTSLNKSGEMDIYAATIEALGRWEPRFAVSRVQVSYSNGSITLELSGTYNGQAIRMPGIEVSK